MTLVEYASLEKQVVRLIRIFKLITLFLTASLSSFVFASEDIISKVVLVGPPASGKGTQAVFLSRHLNIPTISTGDLLRQEVAKNTSKGNLIQEKMNTGSLVEDKIIAELLLNRLQQEDCKNGYILDGFPRNLEQAKILANNQIDINTVVEIDVPDNVVIKRISGRRIHLASGRSYHIDYNPPKAAGVDDVTGEELVQRKDDTLEIITKRLESYHAQTQPLTDFYQQQTSIKYIKVDGSSTVQEITAQILGYFS
jgi:adenylate kinase